MRPLYIFDLDGTLANCEHRLHFLDKDRHDADGQRVGKNYRKFYEACDGDGPIWSVIEILRTLRWTADVWIWSGRSDEAWGKTEHWLDNYDCAPQVVQLRPVGDHRPDVVLKAEWLEQMSPEDRKRLVAVLEDRSRCVKMYRDAGVTCFQVAEGEF